jgi:hypothetical protein
LPQTLDFLPTTQFNRKITFNPEYFLAPVNTKPPERDLINANDQILIDFYKVAKEEMNNRIRLRDSLLAAFVTAIAVVIGFSKAGQQHQPEALYIIPYLCFAFTLLVAYHHLGAHRLGAYCANEVFPNFSFKVAAPLFEMSSTFKDNRLKAAKMRAVGQSFILVCPGILSLFVNYPDVQGSFPRVLYWWFGLVACLMSLYVIHQAYSEQKTLEKI